MATGLKGTTDRLGFDVEFEYRYNVQSRNASNVRVIVDAHFAPTQPLLGVEHEIAVRVGDGTSFVKRMTLPDIPEGSWCDWITVFDSTAAAGVDDDTLSLASDIGFAGFPYRGGVLDDTFDMGGYHRIEGAAACHVVPLRIDVARQDSTDVRVSWPSVLGADSYRVYINGERSLARAKVVVANSKETSVVFNPKNAYLGTYGAKSTFQAGFTLHIAVEPYDSYGVPAKSETWGEPLVYGEVASCAPTSAYLIGALGDVNELAFDGEDGVVFYYSGESNGSYPISRFVLRRQDGAEVSWKPSDTMDDGDMRQVVVDLSGWSKPNEYVQFELRAYNEVNAPVYMPDGKWLRFSVKFYGGVIRAYDDGWQRGLAWVHDGINWRRAYSVSVYSGGWKSL